MSEYQIVNPYTGQTERVFDLSSQAEIKAALNYAQDFYQINREIPFEKRADILRNIAAEILANQKELAKSITENMGKLYQESLQEVAATARIAEYYANNGPKILEPRPYTYQQNKRPAVLKQQALGTILAIEPWNFPFTQVMRVFAPNFLLGNAVILKPAPIVAGCSFALERAITQADGYLSGGFKCLLLSNQQVADLIKQQAFQGVALTGSIKAGSEVAAIAGKAIVKTTLELGGNDPFIVLPGADIRQAAKDAAVSRLRNSGQVCTSAKRYIVHREIAAEFIEQLMAEFSAKKIGDPFDQKTTLAPLASAKVVARLQNQLDTAIAHGAKVLLAGGKAAKEKGNFFTPVLLTNILPTNPMYDQEFFGPVGQIKIVENQKEAIKEANNSKYGLASAIYAPKEEASVIADQLESGQVFINQPSNGYPEIPFGGVKKSGYGREMSDLALFEFANQKIIAY
ncbi:aldehyde dehydrogenase family protein [Liquorilactobacillus sicerae]|uniref:aldehyde dehydrogenase family protein n=1 Tax=Liquorilactobacillus sicerae TaxID=1416943 RepID=UPI002480817E|nr:aldehyde dehydrogenase family protein [Liquorilactobacillus sicerae]